MSLFAIGRKDVDARLKAGHGDFDKVDIVAKRFLA
jgi:hypothetical protein